MSLFNRKSVSSNDAILYSLTINPQPSGRLNGKVYSLYTNDQQIAILGRIEAHLRLKNPIIEMLELHYEKCPSNGQIHFHALYSMPSIYQSTVMAYYRRILDKSNQETKEPWRYIDFTVTDSRSQWLEYIRKDSTK